jgi:glucose/arabinose dehydrogenase
MASIFAHGPTQMRSTSRFAALPLLFSLVFAESKAQAQSVSDPSFAVETIHSGNGMTAIEFDSTGRMYTAEKQGRIMLFTPNGGGFNSPTVVADIRNAVDADQEAGFLGLALDPSFLTNRYIYLFYTTSNDQRLTRMTLNAQFTAMQAGSEVVLVSGLPRAVNYHKAGDIHFHPNEPDNIYISLGDDNDRSGAQDLGRYAGKMLRVNKANGQGLPSNPFQDGNMNSIRSRIWAIGFRNPFRFTFNASGPVPNSMYVSENGNSTDRISFVRMGSNGSWNTNGDVGGFLNPPDTNHRVMATDGPSLVGIAVMNGGAFADPANPNSTTILVGNYTQRRIRRWRLTGTNLDTLTPISRDNNQPFATNLSPIDMQVGPDGALYMTATNGGEGTNMNYDLLRIRRTTGTPPIASFTTSPTPARGAPPLLITFTDRSSDPDGSIASRSWNFGDSTTSSVQNPTHTYNTAGVYTVTLTVTDNSGLQNSTQATVTVAAGTTLSLSGRIWDARNVNPANFNMASALRLYRLDGTTPITFPGGTGAAQNGIPVAWGGVINATVQVELTEPGLVISAAESLGLRAPYQGVAVPAGASAHSVSLTFYVSNTAVRGRVLTTRGAGAQVDIGIARSAATTRFAVAGGRDYLSGSGYPATGVNHRIVSDVFGYYYFPIRQNQGGNFFFDFVADTNSALYTPNTFSTNLGNGGQLIRNVTVGLQNGGLTCDDLSGVAETPNVDYVTQIQPILDARCTGCHNSSSGSNGGLVLDGDSWARLVNVMSTLVPGKLLVDSDRPTEHAASFLFEKINCASPQVGTRMRPTEAMSLAEQGVFRSWISQGALPEGFVQPPVGDPQTPWQTNAYGTLVTNANVNSSTGFHFRPLVNGEITSLGGYFNGSKTVRLYNRTTGALLAETTVVSANNWAYSTITPVPVIANQQYTIAVFLAGPGASYRGNLNPRWPRTFEDIRIDAATMANTAGNPNLRPTNTILDMMPGQADFIFVPSP